MKYKKIALSIALGFFICGSASALPFSYEPRLVSNYCVPCKPISKLMLKDAYLKNQSSQAKLFLRLTNNISAKLSSTILYDDFDEMEYQRTLKIKLTSSDTEIVKARVVVSFDLKQTLEDIIRETGHFGYSMEEAPTFNGFVQVPKEEQHSYFISGPVNYYDGASSCPGGSLAIHVVSFDDERFLVYAVESIVPSHSGESLTLAREKARHYLTMLMARTDLLGNVE